MFLVNSTVDKKFHNCESCKLSFMQVKLYLGQNEDCSLGDSTSDSSERLLQRGSGGRSKYKILVKGEFSALNRSTKDFLLVTRS